jgi:hypothetical protein
MSQEQKMIEKGFNDYVKTEEEKAQLGKPTAGRFNQGKIRYDLIPPWALEQIAKVYTYGTIKYDDDNWWKGMKWRKDVFGCIERHIKKWFRGEKLDDESNLHHLAHAAWNCIALMEYERNRIGTDDRNPYTQDLLPEHERIAKIALWRKLADEGRDSEYNALDIPSDT